MIIFTIISIGNNNGYNDGCNITDKWRNDTDNAGSDDDDNNIGKNDNDCDNGVNDYLWWWWWWWL